jgi:FkbM family methyltransferase
MTSQQLIMIHGNPSSLLDKKQSSRVGYRLVPTKKAAADRSTQTANTIANQATRHTLMQKTIHQFANGLKVYDDHLTPIQRERYKKANVHEPVEEDLFIRLVKAIPQDGCFVDIGAGFGYYAILAKLLVRGLTVYAIEPLERHRLFLAENCLLNELSVTDFIVLENGIALSNGMRLFAEAGYSSHVLHGRGRLKYLIKALKRKVFFKDGVAGPENRSSVVAIKTVTLDWLIEQTARLVDLVQMDVQGLEDEVLRSGSNSMRTGKVKTFLIGTHGPRIHRKCIDILKMHRYEIEFDKDNPADQPDGIIVASKGFNIKNA